jgi:PAS domain S-box-containing protein
MYKKNILVVEDEGLVAKDIQLSLEDMGYNVVNTVSTGEEAIELIEMSNPDLVILDIVLKGEMNGIDTAKEILKKYDVPLIYLTAYGDRDTVKMARETKPLGYIVKPYKQEDLYSTIEVALHTHEMKNKMKESERKYRNLVETIHGGLALVDGDENFLYVNEGMCEILGYSREELQKMNMMDFVREEDRDIILNTTEVKKNGGEFTQYEIVMRRKNGKEAFISVSSSPFLDNKGRYLYTVASFLDITEEKKAQDEIEKILDVEEVLANILSRLINISDIDDNIDTLIADIGRLCNLSRVQFY